MQHSRAWLNLFTREVTGHLELENLLRFAVPALHQFFQTELAMPVNVRLGLVENHQSQNGPIRRLIYYPNGVIEAFNAPQFPDWKPDPVNLDEPGPVNLSFFTCSPVYLEGSGQPRHWELTQPVRSLYVVFPLLNFTCPAEPVAILELQVAREVEFRPEDDLKQALTTLATALVNARRYEQALRTISQLRALSANTADLISQSPLETLLEMTVRRAIRLMEAEGGCFYMVDRERAEVECILDLNRLNNSTGIRLKFGEGVAGKVAASGQPLVVQNYSEWQGRSHLFNNRGWFNAVLGVPVIWQEEILGTLIIVHSTRQGSFTADDVDLMALFAAQAAAAIANNRLLEATLRSRRDLELLYQATALLNSNLKTVELCQAFVSQLVERFGYQLGFIYLLEPDGSIRLQAQHGYSEPLVVLSEDRGICGRVLRTKKAVFVPNARLDQDFIFAAPGSSGGIYVPLLMNEKMVGLIGIESISISLTLTDLRIIEMLGSHLSTSIKNAWLFEQVEENAAQLHRRNQELETVFGGLNEGLMIVRVVNGRQHLQVNPEGMRLFGWGNQQPPAEELNNPAVYKIERPYGPAPLRPELESAGRALDPTPVEASEWPASKALRGERFSGYELLLTGPDKQRRHLSFAGTPVLEGVGQVAQAVVVFRDVTALRAVEQIKEGFISLVSHDLRSPLAAIAGFAAEAIYNLKQPEEGSAAIVRRSLEVITRHSEKLNRLVNDLLDMARLESGYLQMDIAPANAAGLVQELCNYMLETMPELAGFEPDAANPRRCFLRLNLDWHLPPVLLDQQRLDQVLTNLISNAIKYSPRGGQIELKLARDPQDERYARLTVHDQGIGVEPEQLPHLFTRFFRIHQVSQNGYNGTGLGLYICHLMVEALHGRIWAESAGLNQGTAVHLTLPLA